MQRDQFFPASPFGARVERSLAWGVFMTFAAIASAAAFAAAASRGSWPTVVMALAWMIIAGQNLLRWRSLRRPLVEIGDRELIWRGGFGGERRYDLADLALAPDPFDVTLLRLQTRDGRFVRIPRARVQDAERLEAVLRASIVRAAGAGGALPGGSPAAPAIGS